MIDDGRWVPTGYPLTSRHAGKANVTFADGHVELVHRSFADSDHPEHYDDAERGQPHPVLAWSAEHFADAIKYEANYSHRRQSVTEVPEFRFGAEVFFQTEHLLVRQHITNLAIRVEQITEYS